MTKVKSTGSKASGPIVARFGSGVSKRKQKYKDVWIPPVSGHWRSSPTFKFELDKLDDNFQKVARSVQHHLILNPEIFSLFHDTKAACRGIRSHLAFIQSMVREFESRHHGRRSKRRK